MYVSPPLPSFFPVCVCAVYNVFLPPLLASSSIHTAAAHFAAAAAAAKSRSFPHPPPHQSHPLALLIVLIPAYTCKTHPRLSSRLVRSTTGRELHASRRRWHWCRRRRRRAVRLGLFSPGHRESHAHCAEFYIFRGTPTTYGLARVKFIGIFCQIWQIN